MGGVEGARARWVAAQDPRRRLDQPGPVGEARDTAEILGDVLLADLANGYGPALAVMVTPNSVSSMKMPSAWWRSARCRGSAMIRLDLSNHWWSRR